MRALIKMVKQRLFGSINLGELKKAFTEVPSKVGEYKGQQQLKVKGAVFEDGGIAIDVWDDETKTSYKIGNLRVSDDNFPAKDQPAAPKAVKADDLPF